MQIRGGGNARTPRSSAGRFDGGELRAADADRDRTAALLQNAAVEGRLSVEELESRLDKALSAKTYTDLERLVADLPGPEPGSGHGGAGELPARRVSNQVQTLFGSEKLTGRWIVPGRLVVRAGVADITVDITEAVFPNEVVIDAMIGCGQLSLVVPEGVAVDFSEVKTVLSQQKNHVTTMREPGTPVVRVVGQLMLTELVARPPKKRPWYRRAFGK